MVSRSKELVKMLERLIKQDHLYDSEKIIEMKKQLRVLKEQLAEIEKIEKKDSELNDCKTCYCNSRCGENDWLCCTSKQSKQSKRTQRFLVS